MEDKKYYFKAFGLVIEAPIFVKGLIQLQVPPSKIDINISFGTIIDKPIMESTLVNRQGLQATCGVYDELFQDVIMNWDGQMIFRLSNGNKMIIDTKSRDIDFLSLFIISEPLGILMYQRGTITLHASAVTLPSGKGIVFMGEPGMGKSTTTAALVKKGCNIISDDLVVITIINGISYLIPSFPQIKIWKKSVDGLEYNYNEIENIVEGANKFSFFNPNQFSEELVPMGKIFILNNEENNILEKLHHPMEILKYFALPDTLIQKGPNLKKYFELLLNVNTKIENKKAMNNFEELNLFVENIMK